MLSTSHQHVFVCYRNPAAHNYFLDSCMEVFVICPECGSAGRMLVIVFSFSSGVWEEVE